MSNHISIFLREIADAFEKLSELDSLKARLSEMEKEIKELKNNIRRTEDISDIKSVTPEPEKRMRGIYFSRAAELEQNVGRYLEEAGQLNKIAGRTIIETEEVKKRYGRMKNAGSTIRSTTSSLFSEELYRYLSRTATRQSMFNQIYEFMRANQQIVYDNNFNIALNNLNFSVIAPAAGAVYDDKKHQSLGMVRSGLPSGRVAILDLPGLMSLNREESLLIRARVFVTMETENE